MDAKDTTEDVKVTDEKKKASKAPARPFHGGKGKKMPAAPTAIRHRKVLRDNIQGITKPAIRRLSRRAGVKRISGPVYDCVRAHTKKFLQTIMRDVIIMTNYQKRKTVTTKNVIHAAKRNGYSIYGYGN